MLHNFLQLSQFLPVLESVHCSFQQMERVIHAFVYSCLDHCNTIYSCLSQDALTHLRLAQNSVARLLTKTSYHSHITPVIILLHQLPIKLRVEFKILLLTYKALSGLAPECIAELLDPYTPARPLRPLKPASGTSFKAGNTRGHCVCCPWPQAVEHSPLAVRSPNSLQCLSQS